MVKYIKTSTKSVFIAEHRRVHNGFWWVKDPNLLTSLAIQNNTRNLPFQSLWSVLNKILEAERKVSSFFII